MAQQPGDGQNEHQLPQHGDDEAQYAVAQGLTDRGGNDAEGGGQEAEADEAQGGDTDLQHIVGGVEDA